MPSQVERFVAERSTLQSLTPQRVAQIRMVLGRFESFLGQPAEGALADDVRNWMVHDLTHGLMASTVTWRLKVVRSFHRWCWEQELIGGDEFMRLSSVSAPRGGLNHKPKPYTTAELALMWADLAETYPYTTDSIIARWRRGTSPWRSVKKHAMRLQLTAILELALVCGLRGIEIRRLTVDDCHFDNAYIIARGKREDQHDKLREVSFPDSTRAAMKAWFRMRGFMSPEPGLGLWLSVTGPNEGRNELLLQRFQRGIFHDWHLHRLRHTCATFRLRAGMPLEKLQMFLGHANISQTLAYAQLVRGDMHDAAEKTDVEFQRAIRPPQAA